MRFIRLTLPAHLALLALFAGVMIAIWMIPVLIAGYPNDIPTLLLPAKNFALTGMFSMTDSLGRYLSSEAISELGVISAGDGRLSAMLFAWISQVVPFTNLVGWSFVTSLILGASLFPWWIAVRSLFDARVAWISTVIFSLMPIYWREAVFANNYQFALFFLFCSFAAFALLRRNFLVAVAVAGLFFGLSASAKDAFLVFIPWFVICGFVFSWPRWKKGVTSIALFAVCALVPYLAPYVGDIRTLGYPMNQNLARVWPGVPHARDAANEIYLHLYPDPYTYHFDRERFDRELLARVETLSVLERLQYQKILLNFDVGKPGVGASLQNGVWLFLGSIPSYFQQETMGGLFLWLFILPGIFFLWRMNRRFALYLLGLLVATELAIRFVLHFNREHLMDVGWALALLAGVGVGGVCDTLARSSKKYSPVLLSLVVTTFLAGQLLQSNRVRFTRVYESTLVEDTVVAAFDARRLPHEAVIASPSASSQIEQIALLSDRTLVLFAVDTVERLLAEGKAGEAFKTYGITHVMRYDAALSQKLQRAVPDLQILQSREIGPRKPAVSTELRWLLHLIR